MWFRPYQSLSTDSCKFNNKCTFTVYVVSKDYAIKKGDPCEFTLNIENIKDKGAKLYFASSKEISEKIYTSVGTSRLFAVFASKNTLEEAKKTVYNAMSGNIDEKLDYRSDIGIIYEH